MRDSYSFGEPLLVTPKLTNPNSLQFFFQSESENRISFTCKVELNTKCNRNKDLRGK